MSVDQAIVSLLLDPTSPQWNFQLLMMLLSNAMIEDNLFDGYGIESMLLKHGASIYFLSNNQMQFVVDTLQRGGFPEWRKTVLDKRKRILADKNGESASDDVYHECYAVYQSRIVKTGAA